MQKEDLTRFGLDAHEAIVYLALLEVGPAGMTAISKKAGLNRTTLYAVFDRLTKKALLITSVVGKRRSYAAAHPEAMGKLLHTRLGEFNDLLPQLLALHGHGAKQPILRYLEGLDGIKRAFENSLFAKEGVIAGFSSPNALALRDAKLINFWEREYMPARKKKKKFVRLIVPDDKLGRYYREHDTEHYRETRFVPALTSPFQAELHVYDHTVAFISYSAQEEFAVQIVSKPIAETVKIIWTLLWASAY